MSTQKLRRQAYVDDQLSVDELLDFEETLSVEERHELEQERSYERAFAEHLRGEDAPACPDGLWQDLSARIVRDEEPKALSASVNDGRQSSGPKLVWLWQVVAVAALIVLAATLLTRTNGAVDSSLVALHQSNDLEEFAAQAEVSGDVETIRKALADAGFAGIDLLAPDADGYHNIEFYGMRTEVVDGKPVARLFLSCCGRPATAILTTGGSQIQVDESSMKGTIYKGSKTLGSGHRVTLVSPHPVKDAMNLFG